MADPIDRTDTASRRTGDPADDRDVINAETPREVPSTSADRDEESAKGVLKFLGLELGMFATAVILAVIFVVAIIIFAMTR